MRFKVEDLACKAIQRSSSGWAQISVTDPDAANYVGSVKWDAIEIDELEAHDNLARALRELDASEKRVEALRFVCKRIELWRPYPSPYNG